MTLEVVTIDLLMSQAYLVIIKGRTVLIDCGVPGEAAKIIRKVNSAGISEIDLIFLTHAHIDHCGSASKIREATRAPIAIHKDDAGALAKGETRLGSVRGRGKVTALLLPLIQRVWKTPGTQADILLQDGQELREYGIPAAILHTPGHTYGSSCLLAADAAFVGDLVTTTGGKPRAQRFYAESWLQLPSSLEKLEQAAPRISYPGHGRLPVSLAELRKMTGARTVQSSRKPQGQVTDH